MSSYDEYLKNKKKKDEEDSETRTTKKYSDVVSDTDSSTTSSYAQWLKDFKKGKTEISGYEQIQQQRDYDRAIKLALADRNREYAAAIGKENAANYVQNLVTTTTNRANQEIKDSNKNIFQKIGDFDAELAGKGINAVTDAYHNSKLGQKIDSYLGTDTKLSYDDAMEQYQTEIGKLSLDEVNDIEDYNSATTTGGGAYRRNAILRKFEEKGYTEDEFKTLAEHVSFVDEAYKTRQAESRAKSDINNGGVLEAVGSSALAALSKVPAAVSAATEIAKSNLGGYTDKSMPVQTEGAAFRQLDVDDTYKQANKEKIEKEYGSKAATLYDVGEMMLENLANASIATIAGTGVVGLASDSLTAGLTTAEAAEKIASTTQKVSSAIAVSPFAAIGAAEGEKDAQARGLTNRQSTAYAITLGAVEVATENLPTKHLQGLLTGTMSESAVKSIVTQFLEEGIEEGAADVLDDIADAIINGDKSSYNLEAQQYIQNGLDEDTAYRLATETLIADIAYDTLVGGLSGVAGAGSAIAMNYGVNTLASQPMKKADTLNSIYDENGVNYIPTNREAYTSDEAYNAAQKTRDDVVHSLNDIAGNKKVSNKEARNIYKGTVEALSNVNTAKEQSAINEIQDATDVKTFTAAKEKYENTSSEAVQEALETQESKFDTKELDSVVTEKKALEIGISGGEFNESQQEYIKRNPEEKAKLESALQQGKNQKALSDSNTAAIDENTGKTVDIDYSKGISKNGETYEVVDTEGNAHNIKEINTNARMNRALAFSTTLDEEEANEFLSFAQANPDANINSVIVTEQMANRKANEGISFKTFVKNYGDSIKAFGIDVNTIKDVYETKRAAAIASDAGKANPKNVKNGIGKVNNKSGKKLTSQQGRFLQKFGRKFGVDFEIINEENSTRGEYVPEEGKIVINMAHSANFFDVVMHEGIGEFLQAHNADAYNEIATAVLEYYDTAEKEAGQLDLSRTIDAYQKAYIADGQTNKSVRAAANEFVNDQLGKIFATDEGIKDFSNWLFKNDKKSVADKIADFFADMQTIIKECIAEGGLKSDSKIALENSSKEAARIRKMILEAADTAIENKTEKKGTTENSERKSKEVVYNGRTVENLTDILTASEYNQVKQWIDSKKKPSFIAKNGDKVLRLDNKLVYTDYRKNIGISKIVVAQVNTDEEATNILDWYTDFEQKGFSDDSKSKIIETILGKESVGEYTTESFGEIQKYDRPTERGKSRSDAYHAAKQQKRAGISIEDGEDVNPRKSIEVDSDGNNLTKSQQEYFKDSKAVDDNGNLLVLYHGTEAPAFTVFNTHIGSWLSTEEEYSREYAGEWDNWRNHDPNFAHINYEINGNEEVYSDKNLRMYKVYANIKNPLYVGEVTRGMSDYAYQGLSKQMGIDNSEDFEKLVDLVEGNKGKKMWQLTASQGFIDFVKSKGFDGLKAEEGGVTTFCVFDSENQIKLTKNQNPTSNPDVRKSIDVDTEGRKLSENQQEFFKDSKIVDAEGRLKVMYHGTNAHFTEFDPAKINSYGHYGKGFYFTDSKSQGNVYGETYEVYLNLTNPLQAGNKTFTKSSLTKLVQEIADNEDYGIENYGENASVKTIVNDLMKHEDDLDILRDLDITCVGNMVELCKLSNQVVDTDFDGIVVPTETVAFYPNQIKLTSNENPTGHNDMRKSIDVDTEGRKLTDDQREYFKDSKVVDSEGKLKVMYHGTSEVGFTVFSPSASDDGISLFFTDKRSVAGTYSGNSNEFDGNTIRKYIPPYKTVSKNFDVVLNTELVKTDNGYEAEVDGKHIHFDTLEQASDYVDEAGFMQEAGEDAYFEEKNPQLTDGGIYGVYLNATNPLVVNAGGKKWNNITPKQWKTKYGDATITYTGDKVEVDYTEHFDWKHDVLTEEEARKKFGLTDDDFRRIANEGGETYIEDIYIGEDNKRIPITTRELAAYAKEGGYDSLIINDVVDIGSFGDGNEKSQVVVVFDSNQVKSIYNEHPTENPDIRKSIDISAANKIRDSIEVLGDASPYKSMYEQMETVTSIWQTMNSQLKAKGALSGKSIRNMFDSLKSEYGISDGDIPEIAQDIANAFSYMINNEDANYPVMMDYLMQIADEIVKVSNLKNAEQQQIYDETRKAIGSHKIALSKAEKDELKNHYSGVWKDAFGALNKAGIKLDNNGAKMDDGLYEEISDEILKTAGIQLDASTTPVDQLISIIDTMDALSKMDSAFEGYNDMEVRLQIAEEIIDTFYEQAPVMLEREIAKGTEKGKKAIKKAVDSERKKLKEANDEWKAQKKAEYDAKVQELEKSIRETNAAQAKWKNDKALTQQQIKQTARAEAKKSFDNLMAAQDKAKQINKIKSAANRLIKQMEGNTERNHMPDFLKPVVGKFLSGIDFLPEHYNPNAKENANWLSKMQGLRNVMMQMQNMENAISNAANDGNAYPVTDRQAYEMMMLAGRIDAGMIVNMLDNFNQSVRVWDDSVQSYVPRMLKVSSLNAEQLRQLSDVMNALATSVSNINNTLANEMHEKNAEMGVASVDELSKMRKRSNHTEATNVLIDFMTLEEAEPITFFESLGQTAKSIYDELRQGFNKKTFRVREAAEYMLKTKEDLGLTNKETSQWKKQSYTFNCAEGKLTLTIPQIMSLYETVKREQGKAHVMLGGIKVTDEEISNGRFTKVINHQTRPVHISYAEYQDIVSKLTSDQIAMADAMQQFMASECSKWGNNVTMKLYGFTKFTEDDYFPISTDSNSRAASDRTTSDNVSLYAIKNSSFTKSLIPNANNAAVIRDIFDIFTDHVVGMAEYEGYTLPLMDAMQWYNFDEKYLSANEFGMRADITSSVKASIEDVLGQKGNAYFLQFLKNINGEYAGRGGGVQLLNTLMSNYKAQAVMANVRVIVQQYWAIIRAAGEISPKYLIAGLSNPIEYSKKAQENSAIAWWKSQGYYETMLGKSIGELITGNSSVKDKINDIAGKPAGLMDDLAWGTIYHAAELKVKAETNLEEGTEEFTKAVVKEFESIIDHTQVVDTLFHKSQAMRSKNELVKASTAFMAEPTKQVNVLYRATRQLYNATTPEERTEAKQRIARVGAVFILEQLVNAAVVAIIDAARDDDKDDWMEAYLEKLQDNTFDNLNLFAKIPIVKEIFSAMEGYDATRSEVEGIYTAAETLQELAKLRAGESTKTPYGILQLVAQSVSQLGGLPIYSALREVKTAWNTSVDIFGLNADKLYTSNYKKEQAEKKADKAATIELYDSNELSSIKSHMKEVYNEKMSSGDDVTESDGWQAVRDELREQFIRQYNATETDKTSVVTRYRTLLKETKQKDRNKETYHTLTSDEIEDKITSWKESAEKEKTEEE